MKIVLKVGINNNDYSPTHELVINGEEMDSIYSLSESPEDAIIGRDLIDGKDIIRYMKLAYEAGKKGEEFEVIETKLLEEDE